MQRDTTLKQTKKVYVALRLEEEQFLGKNFYSLVLLLFTYFLIF